MILLDQTQDQLKENRDVRDVIGGWAKDARIVPSDCLATLHTKNGL